MQGRPEPAVFTRHTGQVFRVRSLACAFTIVLIAASACGGDAEPFVTCDNGIVVFAGVDCSVVSVDEANLAADVRSEVDALRAEAEADPTKALGNGQTIMRLLSTAPFSVCEALQTDPDGEFLTTETIAPIASELAESTCPPADQIP